MSYLPDGGELYWQNGTINDNGPAVPPNQYWGVFYQILPYIEQKPLWSAATDAVGHADADLA